MRRTYWNKRDVCVCCGRGPEKDSTQTGGGTIDLSGVACDARPEKVIAMQVHHIRYFPEVCCYVHWKCHKEIHAIPSMHPHLIQYEDRGDRRFYEQQKSKYPDSQIPPPG